MRVIFRSACLAAGLIALAGCNDRAASTRARVVASARTHSETERGPGPPTDKFAAQNQQLYGSAELFESLSEQATSAQTSVLSRLIATAAKSVEEAAPGLPRQTRGDLTNDVQRIQLAIQTGSRTDIAYASIEAYRALILAMPGKSLVPTDISLMNYAGLRYRAAADAHPPRWDDMNRAAAFARQHWTMLELRGVSADLAGQVANVLDDMESAALSHDSKEASDAGQRELNLIDRIEAVFKT